MSNTWPVDLQQKLDSDSFEMKYGDTALRSDMDVGPAKVRSRYTDAVDLYTCTIILDYDKQVTLKDFYKTSLSNGTLPFDFNDPFTGLPASFRFAAPPSIRALGGRKFRVSMNWEKLP